MSSSDFRKLQFENDPLNFVKREKYSEDVVEYVIEFFVEFIKEVVGENDESYIGLHNQDDKSKEESSIDSQEDHVKHFTEEEDED